MISISDSLDGEFGVAVLGSTILGLSEPDLHPQQQRQLQQWSALTSTSSFGEVTAIIRYLLSNPL